MMRWITRVTVRVTTRVTVIAVAAMLFLLTLAVGGRLYAQTAMTPAVAPPAVAPPAPVRRPRLAGLATVYFPNSHAELFFGRPLRGMGMDDRPPFPQATLASLFIEQVPANDVGRALAAKHRVPVYATARDAVGLGGR